MTDLKSGTEVLLFASYCGDDNPQCNDRTPCADCLRMSNVYKLDQSAPVTFSRELGKPFADHPDAYMAERVREIFDTDTVAGQFLREDGDGGLASGIYRMAREIERLRSRCGEPNHRPEG